ncbi:MAG: ABC transporter permease [Clostridia bacterium]
MENKRKNVLQQILSIRGMGQIMTVSGGLLVLCIIFGILNPNFYSNKNIVNLLRQIAPFIIVGIGQSYVLITGNIDLSIGSVLGMSCMISATLMTKGVDPWIASLITLIACLVAGVINGGLVAGFKLPPFIATLGTMTVARGIAQLVNNNMNTDAIGESAKGFRDFFYYGKTFTLYNTVWVALALWLVFNFILSQTKTGRHIYAIGSNIYAAKLSGVNTGRSTTIAYVVSAFCAGVVGLITSATGGLGTMDSGMSYELYAVAASVIGGISTLGGQGILLGTIVGASVWGVMQNGLQFVGAPVALRNIIIGIIVIVSVLIDVIIRSGKNKKSIIRFLGVSLKIK